MSTSVCISCKLSILTYILAIISCVGEFTPCETKLFSCKKVNPVVLVLGHSVHEKKNGEEITNIFSNRNSYFAYGWWLLRISVCFKSVKWNLSIVLFTSPLAHYLWLTCLLSCFILRNLHTVFYLITRKLHGFMYFATQ